MFSDRKICTCRRCGYEWQTRREKKPKICPGCHSPNWLRKVYVLHCFKCNHVWNAWKLEKPKRCAGCNALLTRYAVFYNTSLKQYKETREYKKLTAIFNREQRYIRKKRKKKLQSSNLYAAKCRFFYAFFVCEALDIFT